MDIREAAVADAAGIAAIYNDAVERTTAIWNERPVGTADRESWLEAKRRDGRPVLVAVSADGDVLGYATFGPWRDWSGYRHTVEHSVYVREDQRGNGLGKALLLALIDRARALSVHVMVAGIERGNSGSIRLHERLGFEHCGTLRQVGAKFGSWLDLVFLQLVLDERPAPDPE